MAVELVPRPAVVRRGVRLLLTGLLLILPVLTLDGCGSKEETQPLRLGVLPIEDNFPFFVAQEEGFYSRHDLNVELVPFNSARDRDMALQSGEIDGETADPVAVGLLRKGGVPVKIISLTMGAVPGEGRFALLAAPHSDIKEPGDLAGATVAISENTIIEYVADQLLAAAGVDPGTVQKVPVPDMPQRLQLLINDRVDAAVLPDPLATLAEKQGAKVILDDTKQEENFSQVVLVFREETIQQRRAELAKLLEVYEEVAAKVTADPQAYRDLFVSQARVPEALKDVYLAPHYSPPGLPTAADLDRVMEWMQGKGLLAEAYRYSDLVDERVLRD